MLRLKILLKMLRLKSLRLKDDKMEYRKVENDQKRSKMTFLKMISSKKRRSKMMRSKMMRSKNGKGRKRVTRFYQRFCFWLRGSTLVKECNLYGLRVPSLSSSTKYFDLFSVLFNLGLCKLRFDLFVLRPLNPLLNKKNVWG